MRLSMRRAGVVTVTAAALLSGSGWAAQVSQAGTTHAVFVQTNDPSGNSIVAFRRNADGTLTATYATGGKGGRTSGSASDPLASQGSLVLDTAAGLLLSVNAGSDSAKTAVPEVITALPGM